MMQDTDSAAALCRECSAPFQYQPAFYHERGLFVPTRCPTCRAARRATRTTGAIAMFDPHRDRLHVRLDDDDGELVLARLDDFGSDVPKQIWVGMAVSCEVSHDIRPGHAMKRARRLRVAEMIR
jgi:hypothetical protein